MPWTVFGIEAYPFLKSQLLNLPLCWQSVSVERFLLENVTISVLIQSEVLYEIAFLNDFLSEVFRSNYKKVYSIDTTCAN